MLTAKAAVFTDLNSVGIVFLIFCSVVIALFAFAACEGNFDSHISCPFLSSRRSEAGRVFVSYITGQSTFDNNISLGRRITPEPTQRAAAQKKRATKKPRRGIYNIP